MQPKLNRSLPPEDVYFSRNGEYPTDLVRPIEQGALVVVTRLPGGSGRAVGLILKELKAAKDHFRGVDSASREIEWPDNPRELDTDEALDNLNFVKRIIVEPETSVRHGTRPLLRVNVISGTLDANGDMASNLAMVCKFLVPQVRENLFTLYSAPKDGAVISTVIVDLEVPDIGFDVKRFIKDNLTPENNPHSGSVISFDTRSFETTFLLDVYKDILLPGEFTRLKRSGGFKRLVEDYGGNADLALEIYSHLASNLANDGKSTVSFQDAFKAIEPRYSARLDVANPAISDGR